MIVDLALVTEADEQNPVVGDLRLDGTDFVLVEGLDAIAQEISVRLKWWRGEWFLDRRRGTPYLEELLGKGVSDETIRTVLRREIERVPGVVAVRSITVAIDRQTRRATVTFEADTDEGPLERTTVPVGGG